MVRFLMSSCPPDSTPKALPDIAKLAFSLGHEDLALKCFEKAFSGPVAGITRDTGITDGAKIFPSVPVGGDANNNQSRPSGTSG
jgi:hypothetical protein